MWSRILLISTLVACVAAHGRVFEPPSRSSAWRFGFPTPADYDDDGANCGGYSVQHSSNGGKCGICGDAYNIPPPRPHELGGEYGLGLIVARYQPGALITTTVDLTTSHKGFWEFKLCPDPESNDQACFDKHILATEDGETKYYPNKGSTKYSVTYRLPSGVVCDHCVLQWRYTAGNNWGTCANGSQGLGCGPQEQFGACSDISIGVSRNMLRNEAQNIVDDIPSPLMYYLKNGYFDAQQGILHLLRGENRPNPGSNQNSARQTQHRPTQTNQQQLTQSQSLQHTTQNNRRPTQPQQSPTQTNQHRQIQSNQRPVQSNQQIHPNLIVHQNARPGQNVQNTVQTSHKSQGKPTKTGQQKNKPILSQKIVVQKNPIQHNQQSNQQQHTVQSQQHQRPIQQNLNHSLISQLDALIKNYRDQQKLKQQNKFVQSQKSVPVHENLPVTKSIQRTRHTQHFTLPQNYHGPNGNLKQWKSGKSARYKKNKRKRKGKPRKRKKKMPFDEYNRIIKVGTW